MTDGSEPPRKLDVLLTVDVEIWPTSCGRDRAGLREALDRNIYGRTPGGDYGLPHQLARLKEHGLKAVFLVESLCAGAVGLDCLEKIVHMISEAGQEVQLHLHTEWLEAIGRSDLSRRTGMNIRDFSLDDQSALIAEGLDNLRRCGIDRVNAYRAGNYGADFNTLRALARNGIRFDTSYNRCYFDTACKMDTGTPVLQPAVIEGVVEVPITDFEDRPGHFRPMQLAACSFRETSRMLLQAAAQRWRTVVIVSHGFELLNRRRDRADPIMVRRFDRYCRFVADHADRMRMAGFHDLDVDPTVADAVVTPLRSTTSATRLRQVEQAARRLYG